MTDSHPPTTPLSLVRILAYWARYIARYDCLIEATAMQLVMISCGWH